MLKEMESKKSGHVSSSIPGIVPSILTGIRSILFPQGKDYSNFKLVSDAGSLDELEERVKKSFTKKIIEKYKP